MNIDYGFLFIIVIILFFLYKRMANNTKDFYPDKRMANNTKDFYPESDQEKIRQSEIFEYNLRTKTIAVENDFIGRIKPMPINSKVFQSSYLFSDDEMEDIKKGWHYRGMNDRWFMYYKNDKLFIYRYDGDCAFICNFRKLENGVELFEIETWDAFFPSENESSPSELKFDGSFKLWVPYLINTHLIKFRRALINPNDVHNNIDSVG